MARREQSFGEYFAKKSKGIALLNLDRYPVDESLPQIFKGVRAYFDGYFSNPPQADLSAMLCARGGHVEARFSRQAVTHVIALTMTTSKLGKESALKNPGRQKLILTPQWIVDSVRANARVPPAKYVLQSADDDAQHTSAGPGTVVTDVASRGREAAAQRATAEATAATAAASSAVDSTAFVAASKSAPPPNASDAALASFFDAHISRFMGASRLSFLGSGVSAAMAEAVRARRRVAAAAAATAAVAVAPARGVSEVEQPVVAEGWWEGGDSDSELVDVDDGGLVDHLQRAPGSEVDPVALVDAQQARQDSADDDVHSMATPPIDGDELDGARGGGDGAAKTEGGAQPRRTVIRATDTSALRYSLPQTQRGVILHADFDAFFVSVALLSRPDLADKPVAVAHGAPPSTRGGAATRAAPSRGPAKTWGSEISSANYVARAFGVRAGMGLVEARRRCPELHVLGYDLEGNRAAMDAAISAFVELTPLVSIMSRDEAYLDISSVPGDPEEVAATLRQRVTAATGGLTISIGIGANMLLAKLATQRAKPDGIFTAPRPDDPVALAVFLGPQPADALPGVGHSRGRVLAAYGLQTVGQVSVTPVTQLREWLGSGLGDAVAEYARGIDRRPFVIARLQSEVGVHMNYGIALRDSREAHALSAAMARELARRLVAKGTQLTIIASGVTQVPSIATAVASSSRPQAAPLALPVHDVPVIASRLAMHLLVREKNAPAPRKYQGHGIAVPVATSVALHPPTADAEALSAAARNLMSELLTQGVQGARGEPVTPPDIRGFSIVATHLSHPAYEVMATANEAGARSGVRDIRAFFGAAPEPMTVAAETAPYAAHHSSTGARITGAPSESAAAFERPQLESKREQGVTHVDDEVDMYVTSQGDTDSVVIDADNDEEVDNGGGTDVVCVVSDDSSSDDLHIVQADVHAAATMRSAAVASWIDGLALTSAVEKHGADLGLALTSAGSRAIHPASRKRTRAAEPAETRVASVQRNQMTLGAFAFVPTTAAGASSRRTNSVSHPRHGESTPSRSAPRGAQAVIAAAKRLREPVRAVPIGSSLRSAAHSSDSDNFDLVEGVVRATRDEGSAADAPAGRVPHPLREGHAAAAAPFPPALDSDVRRSPVELAASLRYWMVSIGPHPSPQNARMLVSFFERLITIELADAVVLLRTLRRYCRDIEAEREAAFAAIDEPATAGMASNDDSNGNAERAALCAVATAWAAGGPRSATWTDAADAAEIALRGAGRAMFRSELEV